MAEEEIRRRLESVRRQVENGKAGYDSLDELFRPHPQLAAGQESLR